MNRGSPAWQGAADRYPQGFNEAPIHESGKFRCSQSILTKQTAASMRPRFMNRGSDKLPALVEGNRQLQ